MQKLLLALAVTTFSMSTVTQAETVSIPTHDAFFDNIQQYCGKAFRGEVTEDNFKNIDAYFENELIMHVRYCSDDEIHIPFHVGDNRSRTWILKKTGNGISLKHDHREPDGSPSDNFMYGGHTVDAGWEYAQAFPADQFSKEDFIRRRTPQSVGNTWHMYIYPGEFFAYRLTREGRELRVDFDLTEEVAEPPAPWGHE